MDRTERFYKIDQMIHDRGLVTCTELLEALETASTPRTPTAAPSTNCPASGSTRAKSMRC